jgi:hypothetical protein
LQEGLIRYGGEERAKGRTHRLRLPAWKARRQRPVHGLARPAQSWAPSALSAASGRGQITVSRRTSRGTHKWR